MGPTFFTLIWCFILTLLYQTPQLVWILACIAHLFVWPSLNPTRTKLLEKTPACTKQTSNTISCVLFFNAAWNSRIDLISTSFAFLSHLPVLAPPEFAAHVLRPTWTTHIFFRWSQHTWTNLWPMAFKPFKDLCQGHQMTVLFAYVCMTMLTLLEWTHDSSSSNTEMCKFPDLLQAGVKAFLRAASSAHGNVWNLVKSWQVTALPQTNS